MDIELRPVKHFGYLNEYLNGYSNEYSNCIKFYEFVWMNLSKS